MGCDECTMEKNGYDLYTYGYDPNNNPYFRSKINDGLTVNEKLSQYSFMELLDWKFRKQLGIPANFSEISPEEFQQALKINPFAEEILARMQEQINKINFEKDIAYENIKPIKVIDQSGEAQYYHGTYNKKAQCHGLGIWTKDGNVYCGNFKNDEFSGVGLFISPIGDYYFGGWQRGQLNGEGYIVVKDKIVYKGSFLNNRKDGKGEEILPNGDSYTGTFFKGQKNGKGSYLFSNGSVFDGNFANSKYNGYGEMKWNGGKSYCGGFKNGQINSAGNMVFGDGSIFQGNIDNTYNMSSGTFNWQGGKSFQGYWDSNVKGSGIYNDSVQGTREMINLV